MRIWLKTVILAIAVFQGSFAWASRLGMIDVESADLQETPTKESSIVTQLKKGTRVLASNVPLEGYHKVKTADGRVGWVKISDLVLQDTPEEEPEKLENPKPSEFGKELDRGAKSNSMRGPSLKVRALGGVTFYSASGIVANFDNLSLGYTFGGEIHTFLSRSWSVGLRVETISQSVSISDASTSKNYSISLGSLPLLLGLEFQVLDDKDFLIHVAGFGGYAISTRVTSVSLSDTTDTTAESSSGALTGLLKADLHYKVSKGFTLFLEGGYRYLQSGAMARPSPVGNGGGILNSNFTITMSGAVVGVGVGLTL